MSNDLMARLGEFDTPTICNTIELFDVRPRNVGFMDMRIQCNFPELPPMVGYASTALFGSDHQKGGRPNYELLAEQMGDFAKLPGPAVVVVQDIDDPPVSATFGDIMCSAYKAFGAAGLITSGAGRDLDQVQAIGFPVFTGSTICAHGYCHFKELDVPLRIGGMTIHPGDLLHGDRNGVTTIPKDIANEIPDAARQFADVEGQLISYLKEPSPTPAGVVEHFEQLRQRSMELSKSVQSKGR
ncbi:MAG: dimethylmenaquinone methyltransferase [Phycisphaeraceae bacterium]|nr:dimethylmenaquinone methyltransferase [Phycisphaeraceae bacterium]